MLYIFPSKFTLSFGKSYFGGTLHNPAFSMKASPEIYNSFIDSKHVAEKKFSVRPFGIRRNFSCILRKAAIIWSSHVCKETKNEFKKSHFIWLASCLRFLIFIAIGWKLENVGNYIKFVTHCFKYSQTHCLTIFENSQKITEKNL